MRLYLNTWFLVFLDLLGRHRLSTVSVGAATLVVCFSLLVLSLIVPVIVF